MTLQVGMEVRIDIKRLSRWEHRLAEAMKGTLGTVVEIKPENGNNNILVDFYVDAVTPHARHSCFHFLEEDLVVEDTPVFKPVAMVKTRMGFRANMLGLLRHVENHGLTLQWCDSGRKRGVLWDGDRLSGLFTLCAKVVLVHVELDTQPEW